MCSSERHACLLYQRSIVSRKLLDGFSSFFSSRAIICRREWCSRWYKRKMKLLLITPVMKKVCAQFIYKCINLPADTISIMIMCLMHQLLLNVEMVLINISEHVNSHSSESLNWRKWKKTNSHEMERRIALISRYVSSITKSMLWRWTARKEEERNVHCR